MFFFSSACFSFIHPMNPPSLQQPSSLTPTLFMFSFTESSLTSSSSPPAWQLHIQHPWAYISTTISALSLNCSVIFISYAAHLGQSYPSLFPKKTSFLPSMNQKFRLISQNFNLLIPPSERISLHSKFQVNKLKLWKQASIDS